MKKQAYSILPGAHGRALWILSLVLLLASGARGAEQDIELSKGCDQDDHYFTVTDSTVNLQIGIVDTSKAEDKVEWSFENDPTGCTRESSTIYNCACAGVKIEVPDKQAPLTSTATIKGNHPKSIEPFSFTLKVTGVINKQPTECTRKYSLKIVAPPPVPDPDLIVHCTTADNTAISYAARIGQEVCEKIGLKNASSNETFQWTLENAQEACSQTTDANGKCLGLTVTVPSGGSTSTATIRGKSTAADRDKGDCCFTLSAKKNSEDVPCERRYRLHVVGPNDPGGWGDPHITTVDGVHYDFQSAGEFTALREPGFEVQTRQTPVPTTYIPGTNEYTGLAGCVSIYTAVAARIGSNRVTYQPNQRQPGLFGQADPSGMQLRVNGQLVTLTGSGINLMGGGGPGGSCIVEARIVPAAGGAIEITDARGTQLVATPAFWPEQQKWYLNVVAYQTSAVQGIWGRRADGSWLPALPDGTSLGPMPESLNERYQQLYEQFADAWRVTNATSLFDYAPGTNTGTFTLDEWPRREPESCALEGQRSVQPTTQQAAEQACSGVTDAARKADCIFDVTVTGETGFAQSYEAMQRFRPHGTGWQPTLAGTGRPRPGTGSSRYAWSLHAGTTDPRKGFAAGVDGDLLVEADLEVALSSRFSLNAVLGRYDFDPDSTIFGGTLYARGYLPGPSFRFFTEVGAGLYDPDNLDLSWGLSGGLGMDWALSDTWRAELGADLFHLFNDDDDLEFLAYKIGVRRAF